ncbi:hypothetical protein Sjap_022997 [Stephania japonica]|uniref:Uncharacterized protein n=1 Tax=Stephania japonica TaxID=461633 RepID=A0AAP0HVF2_9MAGN
MAIKNGKLQSIHNSELHDIPHVVADVSLGLSATSSNYTSGYSSIHVVLFVRDSLPPPLRATTAVVTDVSDHTRKYSSFGVTFFGCFIAALLLTTDTKLMRLIFLSSALFLAISLIFSDQTPTVPLVISDQTRRILRKLSPRFKRKGDRFWRMTECYIRGDSITFRVSYEELYTSILIDMLIVTYGAA